MLNLLQLNHWFWTEYWDQNAADIQGLRVLKKKQVLEFGSIMAVSCVLILRAALLLLLTAHVVPLASGCNVGFYETMITEFCLEEFHLNMRKLDPGLWCSWPDTVEIYKGLTNCTYQVALRVDCFWPNEVVDSFFMKIHQRYFNHCALTGRLLHDPPISILAPFIAIPVLVTLLMTAIVVWRSKRTEGVL